jgi:hypothetical protein
MAYLYAMQLEHVREALQNRTALIGKLLLRGTANLKVVLDISTP